jgi:hypothetical protein
LLLTPFDSFSFLRTDVRNSRVNRYALFFGIPDGFDWRNAPSLGLRLIISLVEQISGTIELDMMAGTTFNIVVKEKE